MLRTTRATRRLAMIATMAVALLVPPMAGGRADAIVGGVGVSPSIYPQFVKLLTPNLCGGTVIAPDIVLTAAHCVDEGVTPASITAFVSDVTPRAATGFVIHPLWTGEESDGHDLALIDLTPGSTAGVPNIQVGSPWNTSYYAANTPATIVGHGRTCASCSTSAQLRAVDTVLRSDDFMDDIYNPWYWFDNWNSGLMIGAGSNNATACNGDSGGPLVVDKDGTWNWIQVGVASFVQTWPTNCAKPAGFAELSGPQLAWVASLVPSIMSRWGTCYTPSGYPGQPSARYQGWYWPSGGRDGQYYWDIACYGIPNPPPTTNPGSTTIPGDPPPTTEPGPTTTEPDDTIPPICIRKPWACPDL